MNTHLKQLNRIRPGRLLLGLGVAAALLLAAFGLARAGSLANQPLVWNEATPLPVPMGAVSVQCPDQPDSFYLVGGTTTGWVELYDVYRYDADPEGGTWTELAPIPLLRRALAAACYQGKIYAAGGMYYGAHTSLLIYDIASDTWSPGADLPDPILGAAMGAWDGKLYLAGGTRIMNPWTPVERVDVYDIATDTWTAGGGTPMLAATSFTAARQAGSFLYIAGGFVGDGVKLHDETQRYNMATGDWELGPALTIPQWGGGLAVNESRLYLVGGSDNAVTWNPLAKVDFLELEDWPGGDWSGLGDPLPQVNIYPASACTKQITGGEIWAIGGSDGAAAFYDDNLYRLAEPCVSFGVNLAPESLEGDGRPGETVEYSLTLTNTGNTNDYFSLSATSAWEISFPEMVGPLGAGESAEVIVSVTIPEDAKVGDTDTAVIIAASISNPAETDSSSLTTTVVTGWTEAEPIPHITTWAATIQCPDDPDRFYILGGYDAFDSRLDDFRRYDAVENTWTDLASFPYPVNTPSAVCNQGKIYVFREWDFFTYDIASDTWEEGLPPPRRITEGGIGIWNGSLFFVGGWNGSGGPDGRISRYDIASGEWTLEIGIMPDPVWLAGWTQVGPYLYVAGGTENTGYMGIADTYRYDMSTNTWEQGPDLESPSILPGLVATGTRLYMLGGSSGLNEYDGVYFQDLSTWPNEAWTDFEDPLPVAMGAMSTACTGAVTGGEIWSTGGAYVDQYGDLIVFDTNLYHPAEACISFGLSLAPGSQAGEGNPGDTVDYTLILTNTGNTTDYFSLSASSAWEISFPEMVGPLGAGESVEVIVGVIIPPDAGGGDADTAVVTAASISNPAQTGSSSLTTTNPVVYLPELAVEVPALSAYPGEMVAYSLQLTNQGNLTDTYDLSLSGNLWDTQLSTEQVTLGAGESATLAATVAIPPDALDGATDVVTVWATSQGDPSQQALAELTTAVIWHQVFLPVLIK